MDEKETHRKIASHCFRVMGLNLRRNICGLLSYGTQCIDVQRQAVDQHLSADLQYACHYWVYHLEQSKTQISEILPFLKKHFLHWLEAMSVMGIIEDAVKPVSMVNTLQSRIGVRDRKSVV